MTALTKLDIAKHLAEHLGLSKREAKEMVEIFFSEVRDTLVSGTPVKLAGFGKFILRDKKSRPGRNPKTGELIPVTARRVVGFKPSQKLKMQVEYYCNKQELEDGN